MMATLRFQPVVQQNLNVVSVLNNQTSILNQNVVRLLDRVLQLNLLIPPSNPQSVQFVSTFHSLVNVPSYVLHHRVKTGRYPLRPTLANNYHALLIQMPH